MFIILVALLAAILSARSWQRSVEQGTATFGRIEFDDDHPRQPSVRQPLIDLMTYVTKAYAVGLGAGAVVGLIVWFATQVAAVGTITLAVCTILGGFAGRTFALWKRSTPDPAPLPIRIPLVWYAALGVAGLAAIAIPLYFFFYPQQAQPTVYAFTVAGVGLAVMIAAHVGQLLFRRRMFIPAAGPEWNRSLRSYAISQLLAVAVLAGFSAALVSAFSLPYVPGFRAYPHTLGFFGVLLVVGFLGAVFVGLSGMLRRLMVR